MQRLQLLAIIWLLFFQTIASNSDIELIRSRFADAALSVNRPVNIGYVRDRMNSLKDNGSWPDINYEDCRNIAFQHVQHLSHMVEMARAYRIETSELYQNEVLKEKLLCAIDFWTGNDFICENWWNNEIGTPTQMLNLLYIMDEALGSERAERMLKIALRANMKATGARPSGDRMKIASLYTKSMLWSRNEKEVVEMIDFMGNEMRYYDDETFDRIARENPQYFAGGRGLQADLSFHHRNDRVNNTLTYGEGHAIAFCEWASNIYDTRYRFNEEAIRLMVDYYLDGMCKQMVYGIQSDPGVMNRDMARTSTGKQLANNSIAEALLMVTDYRKDELQNIIDLRHGEKAEIKSFAKSFFNSDHFVFQRPTYYASVRMYSTRSASMEVPYNGEGFTNHYRGDGANYLSVTGDEYASIYPTFDFRKVPGTTVLQADTMPDESLVQQWGITDYAGGVDDGLYGAAAFNFISPIDKVAAKKSWFFFDNFYVCLGSGISSDRNAEVLTTVNQCFLKGEVVTSFSDKGQQISSKTLEWVHHGNVGYIFPKGGNIVIKKGEVTGSWRRLNRQTTVSDKPVSNNIFSLYLNHGQAPQNGQYAYIVAPQASIEQMQKLAQSKDITIISNNPDLQAVKYGEIIYAAFYKSGEMKIDKHLSVSVDAPSLLILKCNNSKIGKIVLSDPTHKSDMINISIKSGKKTTSHNVILPKDQLAGSSVKSL